jgi:ribosome recycling factor
MSLETDLADAKAKLEKSIAQLQHEFKSIRTGRATTAIVDNIQVEAYGAFMALSSCASVTVPEATQLLIKPWDKAMLKPIEKAISEANIGLTPQSDGSAIRLNLPPLSTERRKQLVAQAKDCTEKAKVAMRNVRRDAIKAIETKGKADKLPEDAVKKTSEKVSELLKQTEAKAEQLFKEKSDDIMSF